MTDPTTDHRARAARNHAAHGSHSITGRKHRATVTLTAAEHASLSRWRDLASAEGNATAGLLARYGLRVNRHQGDISESAALHALLLYGAERLAADLEAEAEEVYAREYAAYAEEIAAEQPARAAARAARQARRVDA